jgi:hypothetical protein
MLFPRAYFEDAGRKEPQRFTPLNDPHHANQHQVAKRQVRQRMPQLLHDFAHLVFDLFILGGVGLLVQPCFVFRMVRIRVTRRYLPNGVFFDLAKLESSPFGGLGAAAGAGCRLLVPCFSGKR